MSGYYPRKWPLENTGTILENVHDPILCMGRPCVLHNRTKHSMRHFPQMYRMDNGLMERVCPHGVGHPDPDSPEDINWTHGCDGCCSGSYEEPVRGTEMTLSPTMTPIVVPEVPAPPVVSPAPRSHRDPVWSKEFYAALLAVNEDIPLPPAENVCSVEVGMFAGSAVSVRIELTNIALPMIGGAL